MKNVFFILTILSFSLIGCDVLEPNKENITFEGTWTNSGGRDRHSFRNHHFTFDLTGDDTLQINIQSDEYVAFYIIDRLDFVYEYSGGSLTTTDFGEGTYELVVATYYEGVINANYVLTMEGNIANFKQIESDYKEIQHSWTNSGGRNPASYRNRHYLLTTSQETYLDVVLNSQQSNKLYIIDSLNFVQESNGNVIQKALAPGTYRIVIATYYTNVSANYIAEFFGHFDEIKAIESQEKTMQGSWTNSGGRNFNSPNNPRYKLNVLTPSNIDVVIDSQKSEYLYIIKNGEVFYETSTDNFSVTLEQGEYTLVVATYYEGESGNYILHTFGENYSIVKQ